jgi:hypothetical protein
MFHVLAKNYHNTIDYPTLILSIGTYYTVKFSIL